MVQFSFLNQGLGDSGAGWMDAGEVLRRTLPHFKFVFPSAPSIPITINGGMTMPGWYDIKNMDIGSDFREDIDGMEVTRKSIVEVIKKEMEQVPSERIVLGGFSQGGAITLYTLINSDIKLGAGVVLSAYLPDHKQVEAKGLSDKVKEIPMFMAHGSYDNVVHFKHGKDSYEMLKKLGASIDFKKYGMEHSACMEELQDLANFLSAKVPEQ